MANGPVQFTSGQPGGASTDTTSLGLGSGNAFVINGITLTNNTLSIRSSKENVNKYSSIIRHKHPVGIRSGRSTQVFIVELAFPGVNEINDGLRSLIATFNISPFVQIQSDYIASIVQPEKDARDMMAASLSALSVRTEPGLPDTFFATLSLVWFNYAPYSSNYTFKKSTRGVQAFSIADSDVYQDYFSSVLDSYSKLHSVDSKTNFLYNDMKQVQAYIGVKTTDVDNVGLGTMHVSSRNIKTYGSTSSKMYPKAGASLQELSALFRSKVHKVLPINNMFVSEFSYNNTDTVIVAHQKDHNAGLAFDVVLYDVEKKKNPNADDRSLLSSSLIKEQYDELVLLAEEQSFAPTVKSYGEEGSWHFRYTGDADAAKAIEEYNLGNAGYEQAQLDEIKTNSIAYTKRLVDQGYIPTESPGVWYKKENFLVEELDQELAVVGMSITITNSITTIPIIGHELPTHQYLGGMQTSIHLSTEGIRFGRMKDLMKILNGLTRNAVIFRKSENSNELRLQTSLTDLFGIGTVMVDGTDIRTIEGSPDLDVATMSFSEYNNKAFQLQQEKQKTGDYVRKKVMSIMKQFMRPHEKDPVVIGLMVNDSQHRPYLQHDIHLRPGIDPPPTSFKADYLTDQVREIVYALNTFIDKANNKYEIDELYGLETLLRQAIAPKEAVPRAIGGTLFGNDAIEISESGFTGLGGEFLTVEETLEVDKDHNIRLLMDLRDEISRISKRIVNSGYLEDDIFDNVREDIYGFHKDVLTPCYTDLLLPVNEETGRVIDTEPDFYFWNEDTDGGLDEKIRRDANKSLKGFKGLYNSMANFEYDIDAVQMNLKTNVPIDNKDGYAAMNDEIYLFPVADFHCYVDFGHIFVDEF